jgi:multidrug efflux pump subunit AcrA (membrane-fusion protein)
LGVAPHRSDEGQGVGVLVEVRNAPAGLGPGARVPVELLGTKNSGVLVPRDAVIYDDGGALVYKQLTSQPPTVGPSRPSMASETHYKPMRVKLLQAQGDSWLVDGVDDDDNIVVHGAGVLWSLQGLVGHAAGDMDDD